ncbi:hypothetical protein [Salinactinospora qingdaonensis]|uniref:Uncharacterized protein n=1 Tax=Salinactinospora qingdaonensis TaxID=702744 RepID=A0ABP7FIF3_9ACTN
MSKHAKTILIVVAAVIVGVVVVAVLLGVLGGILWAGGSTSDGSGTVGVSSAYLTA